MVASTEEYAGFGKRVFASLIDTVIFSIIFLVIHVVFFGDSGIQFIFKDGIFQIESDGGAIEQIAIIGITLFMWVKFLGTPGKLILACHVLDAKTHQHIKPLQAVIRYLSYFVSIIPLGLGFFWILWDKKKQGFHDKLAGTVVVVESNQNNFSGQDESQKSVQELMDELR